MFKIGDKVLFARKDGWHASEMDVYIGAEGRVESIHNGMSYVEFPQNAKYIFDGTGLDLVKEVLHKFKIGDRVKVVKARVEHQYNGFDTGMQKFEDEKKIFTIEKLCLDDPKPLKRIGYLFKECGRYSWDEECLRRVRKAPAAPQDDIKPPVPQEVVLEAPVPVVVVPRPITLKEELRKRVADRPGVCSYGLELKNGEFIFHIRDVCHARLFQKGPQEVVKLILDIKGHSLECDDVHERTSYHRYVNYILNHSPWSPIFHRKGLDHVLKHGVSINVEKPSFQCLGAAVALREGSEHSGKLTLFNLLLDKGYSGNTAYLLSAAVIGKQEGFQWATLSNSHKVLHGGQDSNLLFKFFREGYENKRSNKPYRTNHAYTDGVFKHIAPETLDFNMQINMVMKRGLKVASGDAWDSKRTIRDEDFFAYADSLETLLND